MALVPITSVGRIGVNKDLPAHLLPPEAWSDSLNVRFHEDSAEKIKGHRAVFDPPTVAPLWALDVRTASSQFWTYGSLGDLYSVDNAGTHTKLTRASGGYSAQEDFLWNGGLLGGVPIVNNGFDDPQYQATVGSGTLFEDLANWPAATLAVVVRPFKSFLVALNVTKPLGTFPHMVKWSHPADPGTIPISWDETDPTLDAGETELTDVSAGIIRDGLGLRDIFVIYKDSATWGMQFIGGQFIFRFFPILTTSGILADHCVSTIPPGTQQFVATGEDIIVHDGQQARSVIDRRTRRFLNNQMSPDNFRRSFTFSDVKNHEAGLAFPTSGSTWPNLMLIWNWREDTVHFRETADVSFAVDGIIEEASQTALTWDSAVNTWDSVDRAWGQETFSALDRGLLLLDPVNTKLYEANRTNQFNAVNMTAFVERTGLAIVGRNRVGEPIVDMGRRKLTKRIWVRAEGDPFEVSVGDQEELGGAVTWQPSQTFTPGVDTYLDFCANGRLLAVRFESTGDVAWKLNGYDLEVEPLGEL